MRTRFSFCRNIRVIAFFAFVSFFAKAMSQNFNAINGYNGTIVIIDINTNKSSVYNSDLAKERTAPCSTFKIWNTLIGSECGIIKSKDEPFYKWDGVKRFYDQWNQNLTLREAFKYSCVPSFQSLARKIGYVRMKDWINKIGYGNKNITSGIDLFWLPAKGRDYIKISPMEQAVMIKRLIKGELGFSQKSINLLMDVSKSDSTENGTLYGKTGTGEIFERSHNNCIGWYVGFIKSKKDNYVFACMIEGKRISGKTAEHIMRKVLLDNKYF